MFLILQTRRIEVLADYMQVNVTVKEASREHRCYRK